MPQLHIELPDELHKKLKLHAINTGKSLRQCLIEFLDEYK